MYTAIYINIGRKPFRISNLYMTYNGLKFAPLLGLQGRQPLLQIINVGSC